VKQKRCSKCSETKPVSEFYKQRTGKDGCRADCRSCCNEYSRQWHGANKERAAESHRRWYEANKEGRAETVRQWSEANKERKAETNLQWQKENPKQYAYNVQKKRAQHRGIEFLLTLEQWCKWWGDDFDNRGCTKGKLVMARYGDKGPYALGNIKKITCSENMREANEFRRKSKNQAVLEV
jgi:hypothetical protein